MNKNYTKAVKLKRTLKYNTYQFYGEMANKNIGLTEGLKYAALCTYKWLRERLEESDLPKELIMPNPSEYKKVKNEDFKSFYLNDTFLLTVETNIDEGLWSLRIIENDLGALLESEMVAGRVIQSDIGYRVVDNKLLCAFKTTISDAKGEQKANCIRFKLVKELGISPIFGLKQINNLYDPNNMLLDSVDKIESLKYLIKSKENQLPFIIYTCDDNSVDINNIDLTKLPPFNSPLSNLQQKFPVKEKEDITKRYIPYSNRYLGLARAYFLPKKMFNNLSSFLNFSSLEINQVIVTEPNIFGGKSSRYHYDDKERYQDFITNYTRDKELNFHEVLFVDEVKTIIDLLDKRKIQESFKLLDEAENKIEQFKSQQARENRLSEHNPTHNSNKEEFIKTLEDLKKTENKNITLTKEIERLKAELNKKNNYIAYIRRKEQRPVCHKEIPNWIKLFPSLIIHKKAVDLLKDSKAENVDLNVICDALDYLGTAYSDYLFNGLSQEELNEISSNIYNRPFNVSPSGIPVSAKGDCKIKYEFVNERNYEHILDQHLKIGSHGELLRIYFIIDKDRKKIVIGSLPNHLDY